MTERNGERRDHPEHEPAPVVTSKARTAVWVNGNQVNACKRGGHEPAPTIHFGAAMNDVRIVMAKKEDRPERVAQGAGNTPRREDEPAATLDTRTDLAKWVDERPAPTVCGDARGLPEPKHRKGNEWQWNENAVRVTQQEAAILQTFPPDYPWQGSWTKQFEQIGNAVPPLLAQAILTALVGESMSQAEAA